MYLKTEGGGSTKIRLLPYEDGNYEYFKESSYISGGSSTLSYADQDKDNGKWKMVARDANAVLITTSTQTGETSESTLEAGQNNGEVYLNVNRYFVRDLKWVLKKILS